MFYIFNAADGSVLDLKYSYAGTYRHFDPYARVLLIDDSAAIYVGGIRGWYYDCGGCASEIFRYSAGLGRMNNDWILNYVGGSMVRSIAFGESQSKIYALMRLQNEHGIMRFSQTASGGTVQWYYSFPLATTMTSYMMQHKISPTTGNAIVMFTLGLSSNKPLICRMLMNMPSGTLIGTS